MREIDNIATACRMNGFRYIAFAPAVVDRQRRLDSAPAALPDQIDEDVAATPSPPVPEAIRHDGTLANMMPQVEPQPTALSPTPATLAAPIPPVAAATLPTQPKTPPPQTRRFSLLAELAADAPPVPSASRRSVRSVAERRRAGVAPVGIPG